MERNKKFQDTLGFCLGILLAGVLIQAAGWLKGDRLVFPDVGEILRTFIRMLGEGKTWKQIGVTLVHLAEALAVSAVTVAGELFIPLGDLVDFDKEIARLTKELENIGKEMNRSRGMLNNAGFIAKAPAQLVQQEKDKLEAAKAKAAALENRIAELKENL